MKSITVAATVHAPIEKVWSSWTSPAHIKQWCFASDDWGVGEVTNDVRIGGAFKTGMAAKDGSAGFDFGGVYTSVEEGKHIAYDMNGDGRKVSIDFTDLGRSVNVTETFEMENENSEEMQRSGWQSILNNFKAYTEGLS